MIGQTLKVREESILCKQQGASKRPKMREEYFINLKKYSSYDPVKKM